MGGPQHVHAHGCVESGGAARPPELNTHQGLNMSMRMDALRALNTSRRMDALRPPQALSLNMSTRMDALSAPPSPGVVPQHVHAHDAWEESQTLAQLPGGP